MEFKRLQDINKLNTGIYQFMLVCLVFIFSSCSVKKYLQPGEAFYNGTSIKINQDTVKVRNAKTLNAELKNLVRPKPNKKLLGRRWKVWYYYAAGEVTKDKGFRHWMKNKVGEAPVLMSDVNPERNVEILTNYLENNGFFFATGSGDTTIRKKEGRSTYTVTPGHRYHIRKITFPTDSGRSAVLIAESEKETLLKKGNAYNFQLLKDERFRIDQYLKQRGYYLFNEDYILMRVDSNVGNHEVDIYVTVKKETTREALIPWSIDNIFIFPNYEPTSDSIKTDSIFWQNGFFLVDPEKLYKPKVFDRVISYKPGIIYNREDHNKTLSRLVNLGTFRFVKNTFEELPNPKDTGILNAYYYLYAAKQRNIRLESSGKTNSANLAGIELNLNWRNRNLFRGAEQFMFKLYGGFDIQFGGQNRGYNIYHFGAEGSITWPRLVPTSFVPTGTFVPYTKLSISDEWQRRQRLYTVNTFKAAYTWGWRPTIRKEHTFAPIQITFVDNSSVSQEYLDLIALDSNLARVIEEQLIVGPEYNYTYNNTINPKKSNGWYYHGYVSLSNNILGLIDGADAKTGNVKSLFGVQYSQFIKTEQDLRYYRKLSRITTDKQWVNRINLGVGIPYGNSMQLPFIKQFFTGGANSNRAFRVRSVGPGTYRAPVSTSGFIPDLVGDIKLEMNSEYRTRLYGSMYGAAFVDASNIWLFNDNPGLPGAKFSKSFLRELAVGTGIGLRFDIAGIFMIRLDTGIPIRKPYFPEGQRWVFNQIDFGDPAWRKENIILNLAVGLPF
jgi:outer membrane protein assembly factor BamA